MQQKIVVPRWLAHSCGVATECASSCLTAKMGLSLLRFGQRPRSQRSRLASEYFPDSKHFLKENDQSPLPSLDVLNLAPGCCLGEEQLRFLLVPRTTRRYAWRGVWSHWVNAYKAACTLQTRNGRRGTSRPRRGPSRPTWSSSGALSISSPAAAMCPST